MTAPSDDPSTPGASSTSGASGTSGAGADPAGSAQGTPRPRPREVGPPSERDRAAMVTAGIEAMWPAQAEMLARSVAERPGVDPRWVRLVAGLPRHEFVPRWWLADRTRIGKSFAASDYQFLPWLGGVYADQPLITAFADTDADRGGRAVPVVTSGATQPSVLATMLGHARIEPGHRVLEIGTGTAYGTGLLCRWLGDMLVTSIDIDAELAGAARERLARLGMHPRVGVASGFAPPGSAASVDRLVCWCAVSRIPQSWHELLAPGAVVVAPLSFGAGLAVLVKHDDGTLRGRIAREPVCFAPMRISAHRAAAVPERPPSDRLSAPDLVTGTNPGALDDEDFAFWLCAHRPDLIVSGPPATRRRESAYLYTTGPEQASATISPAEAGGWVVRQDEHRLWDVVEDAYAGWVRHELPGREDARLDCWPDGTQYLTLTSTDEDGPDGDPGGNVGGAGGGMRCALPDQECPAPTPWPRTSVHLDGGWPR